MGRVFLPTLPDPAPLDGAVVFGFDDRAFPFTNHLQPHLIPAGSPQVALEPGHPGSHDALIRFYGTVLHVAGTYHLWYLGGTTFDPGASSATATQPRQSYLCYATSSDALHWEKPNLGLVDYRGSTSNNICHVSGGSIRPGCAVLHDPDDPDPSRRFKLAYDSTVDGHPGRHLCVAFSPDGLHWTTSPHNPAGPFMEVCGVAKWRGLYYVTGQPHLTAHRPRPARRLVTLVSSDFLHFSPIGAIGFERSTDRIGPSTATDLNQDEEVHLGAALWNRGNLLLGSYGQWHGHPSGDRRLLTMDLGLVLSHDALHYHEPIPGFKLVPAREQPGPTGYAPSLMQGQGWANVGDQTLHWYAPWLGPSSTGILAATWERDRLGFLQPFSPENPRAITCPFQALDAALDLHANVSGLGPHTHLAVEILDEAFRPLQSLGTVTLSQSGLRTSLRFPTPLTPDLGRLRLSVRFQGIRPEDARLHALYLGDEDSRSPT